MLLFFSSFSLLQNRSCQIFDVVFEQKIVFYDFHSLFNNSLSRRSFFIHSYFTRYSSSQKSYLLIMVIKLKMVLKTIFNFIFRISLGI